MTAPAAEVNPLPGRMYIFKPTVQGQTRHFLRLRMQELIALNRDVTDRAIRLLGFHFDNEARTIRDVISKNPGEWFLTGAAIQCPVCNGHGELFELTGEGVTRLQNEFPGWSGEKPMDDGLYESLIRRFPYGQPAGQCYRCKDSGNVWAPSYFEALSEETIRVLREKGFGEHAWPVFSLGDYALVLLEAALMGRDWVTGW